MSIPAIRKPRCLIWSRIDPVGIAPGAGSAPGHVAAVASGPHGCTGAVGEAPGIAPAPMPSPGKGLPGDAASLLELHAAVSPISSAVPRIPSLLMVFVRFVGIVIF